MVHVENAVDDQVASEDEYDIALGEGVDDESLTDEAWVSGNFTITSYGADYTVDSLVKRMNAGSFVIPKFQRRFIWSQKHASKFVESLLMGLPVPGIFLYKASGTNRHLVIDGQQRLTSLQSFYRGIFNEKKFRLQSVREPWSGRTYEELDVSDQLKLDDSIIHATIFTQDEPRDVLDSIYFVFERINSGGIRLSPQEIRNCIASGPFTELIHELNRDPNWRSVFGGPENKRGKDEELILRFFAMLDQWENYSRPMVKFLNDYSVEMNKLNAEALEVKKKIFQKTISMINAAIGAKAFRPVRSLNAAVFDSVMVGLATRLTGDQADPSYPDVSKAYEYLLSDVQYKKGWESSTADEENVKDRMAAAVKVFRDI